MGGKDREPDCIHNEAPYQRTPPLTLNGAAWTFPCCHFQIGIFFSKEGVDLALFDKIQHKLNFISSSFILVISNTIIVDIFDGKCQVKSKPLSNFSICGWRLGSAKK